MTEAEEQARLLGMSAERELALIAQLAETKQRLEALASAVLTDTTENDLVAGLVAENTKLRRRCYEYGREIEYLRHYGNKDCLYMADAAMERGELDDDAKGQQ